MGRPSKYLVKSIHYDRKAAIAWRNNHRIREWIYKKLADYYEDKHIKNL